MAGTIKIKPADLFSASKSLKEKAQAIQEEAKQMQKIIASLSAGFEGKAKDAFDVKWNNDLYPVIKDQLPEAVHGYADALTKAAEAIQTQDEEIAKALNQG